MGNAVAIKAAAPKRLFDLIGQFLDDQRLDPDPVNYSFAHAVLSEPNSPMAKAVHAIIDGGVRLSRRDIESLGADLNFAAAKTQADAQGLVAKTQFQIEGFADMVAGLHAETRDFGQELTAGANRIRALASGSDAADEVAQLAGAMASRVHVAEAALARTTREADELRSKLEEARDNARRDPLTNMPNRRAFEEGFIDARKQGTQMLLAVCDIDHFKAVNDGFGHSVGDRVLKAIGSALEETCGPHLVARYGGEEFIVLFDGIDRDEAFETLERARAAVAAKRYRVRETDQPLGSVTFSAGLVEVGQDESDRTAFGRADKLLYIAKSAGRNCVRFG